MCGRFIFIPQDELNQIIADVEANIKAQKYTNASAEPAQHEDAFPQSVVPVLTPKAEPYGGEKVLCLGAKMMQWGYPKTWGPPGVVFNTRADTALKPGRNMWAESLAQRRCIVPSYGFYEPHKTETDISTKTGKAIKRQYLFTLPDAEVLFMAGVWQAFANPDGSSAPHFSILTTEPNQWMADVHDRMPVVLRQSELGEWLHGDYAKLFDRSAVELIKKAA